MSTQARVSLAFALAWAGGLGTCAGVAGPAALALALALAVSMWASTRLLDAPTIDAGLDEQGTTSSATTPGPRARALTRALALASLAALLARTLARVLVEVPATLWAALALVATLALARLLDRPARPGPLAAGLIVTLTLAAGLGGARFELGGPSPRGAVHGSPIIGVHPRQAVALSLDGFGPHDIVTDDYVDPPGGMGYDPQAWADRLELELRSIARTHYASGPARAREAYARAEVEVIEGLVPEAEASAYSSLLAVQIRSGTAGEGSTVEAWCPGQPRGPRATPPLRATRRDCPRKYLVDGSSGLGLSPRWPGYTEVRGRDRGRLALALGWPDEARARALELGIVTVLVVLLAWVLARPRQRPREAPPPSSFDVASLGVASLALVGLLGLGLAAPTFVGPARSGPGLTLIAITLIALSPRRGEGQRSVALALGSIGALALLGASPLAGSGDALDLLDAIVEGLVLELELSWSTSRALAGSALALALAAGLGACARAAPGIAGAIDRERRHEGAWALALILVVALASSLRKPGEDLALLHGAGAMFIASTLGPGRRVARIGLGLLCALGALAPLWSAGPGPKSSPLVLVVLSIAALACLLATWQPRA